MIQIRQTKLAAWQLLLVALLLTGSIAHAEPKFTPKLSIVTSIKPLALIAADIGGDQVNVEHLVPVNRSPHDFSLKVSDVKRTRSADLLMWVDDNLEQFMAKLSEDDVSTLVVSQLSGIVKLKCESQNSHHNGNHHKTSCDLHYWLNPNNAILIAGQLGKLLVEIDPANTEYYLASVKRFNDRIAALTARSREEFALMEPPPVIVQHDAYGHFMHQFDLKQLGALRSGSGAKAGARSLGRFLDASAQAACLIVDPQYDKDSAEQFSQRTGLPLLPLDPLGGELQIIEDNYYRFLESTVDTFKRCFASR